MVLNFDHYGRAETPVFTLCNPGSVYTVGEPLTNIVGFLKHTEAEEIIFNFNASHELNFRINKGVAEAESSLCVNGDNNPICILPFTESERQRYLYLATQCRRLVYIDDIGYFVIVNVTEGFSDGVYYKDVKAQSVDVELKEHTVPYIENGTYRIYIDPSNQEPGGNNNDLGEGESRVDERRGLLNILLDAFPLWSIKSIHSDVLARQRTFNDVDITKDCLSFLLDDIQKAYECIVIFDIKSREISVYDQASYPQGMYTKIFLSTSDLINSITIEEDASSYFTAMQAIGGDSTSIAGVNPLGDSVVYNFSYYKDWFSAPLRNRVNEWELAITANESAYKAACLSRDEAVVEVATRQAMLEINETNVEVYQTCKTNILNAQQVGDARRVIDLVYTINDVIADLDDGNPIDPYGTVQNIIDAIDDIIHDYESEQALLRLRLANATSVLEQAESDISDIINLLTPANYFAANGLYEELRNYIFTGTYNDEYIVVTDVMTNSDKQDQRQILYDRTKAYLANHCTPHQSFSIEVESFSFSPEYVEICRQLEPGCLINVQIPSSSFSAMSSETYSQLFVLNFTINYDDKSLSLTVGDKYIRSNPKALFEEIFK